MKLCSFLCILSHASEIHWANTGKVAKKNGKRKEKKKARQLSRDPMKSTSNLSFESDIHEKTSGKGFKSSSSTSTTIASTSSTHIDMTKSSSESYLSTIVHEEIDEKIHETDEEPSCPVTISFGNRNANDPVFECIQHCLAYVPTTTTAPRTTTSTKTSTSTRTSTTSTTTSSTTTTTTSTTLSTTTAGSVSTTSTTTELATSSTTTSTTEEPTTSITTSTTERPTTTTKTSIEETTSNTPTTTVKASTTSLDESSVWTTTTGSTTSEWNSKVTSTIAATTMKPTSTTLGNFQPLVDNILTGLKTCANKSNFPRESGSRKQKKKDLKIIGGVTTSEHDWPWLVYLEMGCGGTIIHEEWVLTAAHCCEGEQTIEARFGLHNTNDGAVSLKTSKIHIHPEYGQKSDGDPENSDWCLLKFDQSIIKATDNEFATQIACLPTGPLEHGQACWIAGWGDTEYASGQYSEEILSAGVNILGTDYCQKYSNVGKLNLDDICAGLPDFDGDGLTDAGKDACQGDSGGPLICVEDGRATVVGVVSRGKGCGQKGQPGLYSSTWSSKDWIVKTVTKN